MQVKRFRGSSMQEALAAVKKEFGEEAVILKAEALPRSGVFDLLKKDTVEVVAAVDVPDSKWAELPTNKTIQTTGKRTGLAETYVHQSKQQGSGAYHLRSSVGGRPAFSQVLNQKVVEEKRSVSKSKKNNRRQAVPPKKREKLQTQNKKMLSKKKRPISERSKKGAPTKRTVKVGYTSEMRKKIIKPQSSGENSRAFKSEESIESLKTEVKKLRSIVTSMAEQLGPLHELSIREFADMPTPLAREAMALIECGIEKHIARELVERATSSILLENFHQKGIIREKILEEMTKVIKTSGPISCKKGRSKVIALVGPTGVGKTTTLAKLAANSKFVFDKKVSLISADTYRMSAIEHLNTFAGIAHLPISAVYSPSELKASLAAQQDKDLVFIDTAGRSPRDKKHMSELKDFMAYARPDEIHLVLPANIKSMDLLDAVRRFSILPVDHIVISKIDETSTLGSMVNIAVEVDNPISYITNGQMIPDDIELANSRSLADKILRAA